MYSSNYRKRDKKPPELLPPPLPKVSIRSWSSKIVFSASFSFVSKFVFSCRKEARVFRSASSSNRSLRTWSRRVWLSPNKRMHSPMAERMVSRIFGRCSLLSMCLILESVSLTTR